MPGAELIHDIEQILEAALGGVNLMMTDCESVSISLIPALMLHIIK
jgi:hypothetical protein